MQVARALMQRYNIASVVVSMGKEGAIFVEGDETIWAVPPAVEVKSTVGAGDAMVAGIVAGKIRGLSLAECARLATAFSMTAISHIGSGLPSIEAVRGSAGAGHHPRACRRSQSGVINQKGADIWPRS